MPYEERESGGIKSGVCTAAKRKRDVIVMYKVMIARDYSQRVKR